MASVRKLPSRKRSICMRMAGAKRLRSSARKFFPGSSSDWWRRRSTRRADLAARSVRASSSRNASWLSPSLAARRAVSSTALAIAPKLSPRSSINNSSRGLAMPATRGKQGVIVAKVDRRFDDRRRRGGLAAAGEFAHRLEGRRSAAFEQQLDRQLDFAFRGTGRQVQQPQVLSIGLGWRRREQFVIGAAEGGGRKQFFAVAVVRERAWLAHQRPDQVPVIDPVPIASGQSRQGQHRRRTVIELE